MPENFCSVYQHQPARDLFRNADFLNSWRQLHDSCPWATVFQSADFVLSWFDFFTDFHPIILSDWDGSSLNGLLILVEKRGVFTAPGFDMAEYQGWIAIPEHNQEFIDAVLKQFEVTFPKRLLYLKYLQGINPNEIFSGNDFLRKRTLCKYYERPMMFTDPDFLQNELKKKNKKEKINRLKRIGTLSFARISKIEEFQKWIDEMALQSDFRKGALYDKTFFTDEPQRKNFLIKLFELGSVHVSVLKVDDVILASNAGIMDPKVVYLQGINSHSPFYSKYSPGILHFLMLGISLYEDKITYLDLTPGGADGYKSSLSNQVDTAYEFWFGPSSTIIYKRNIEKLKNKVKGILNKRNLFAFELTNFKEVIAKCKSESIFRFRRKVFLSRKYGLNFLDFDHYHLYFVSDSIHQSNEGGNSEVWKDYIVNKNHIPDLFLFKKTSKISRRFLFSDCLSRIEFGQEMFTITFDNELIGIYWYVSPSAKTKNLKKSDPNGKAIHTLLSSYYKSESVLILWENLKTYITQNDNLWTDDKLVLEVAAGQKSLLKLVHKSEDWRFD